MENQSVTPTLGEVFNNYLLAVKKFTENNWKKINQNEIFSSMYAETLAILKQNDHFKIIRVNTTKQLELIKQTMGQNAIYGYFAQLKPQITSILGPILSDGDLEQKLQQFNLIYCCEKYAKINIGQAVILCLFEKDGNLYLSKLDHSFFYKQEEREGFGKIIKFYTPK
jgi:hypothetical protein